MKSDLPTRPSPDASVLSPRVDDSPAGLVNRPWLTSAVGAALADPDCRIVLLTGEMGTGKSTFVEGWNARHPASLLYSIRRDSHHRNRSGAANDLLEAIVRHFTGVFPGLFRPQGITISAAQDADEVAAAGSMTGIRIDELVGLPFAPLAIELVQLIGRVSGRVSGIEIGRYVTDPRLLDTGTLADLALLDPARSAGDSDQRLIIVVDALDELAAAGEGHAASIVGWLEDSPAFPPAVRFLISSRPGHHLDSLRQVHAESLREINLAGHVAEATGDIIRYCQHVLGGSSDEPRRKRWIEEVADLARGNFLFVVLLLREFAEQGYVLSDHTAVLPSLASVPSELGGLYDLLLRKLRDRIGDEPVRLTGTGTYASAWSEVYEPVLGVLATAAAPLTTDQITAFADLRVRRESVRGALRKMASLLSNTKTDGTSAYSFVHQSLAQHLIGDETGSRSDFAIDASAWHLLIAASLWQGTGKQWLVEQDEYRVRYLGTHLRQSIPADDSARQRLSALLRDPAFLARKIEVAGVAAAMADIGAAVPLISAGPHREMLQAIYDTLSVSQAALRAGADPLSTLVNGLTAEKAAPTIAEQAARLAQLRGRPYIRLTQILCMPRPPQRRQLGGFLGSLAGCAVDAQAAHILTASVDGQIRLWDRSTERELRAMPGRDMACSCAISSDGAMLVAGYGDGLTAVWLDVDEPVLADRADSSVACVAVNSADVVVAARLDGTLTAWQIDRADRRSRVLWTAELGAPLHCCAIAESGMVIAGDGTGQLHVISDAGTARWAAHPAPVRACAIFPDGNRAVTGSYDGTLAVWDLETGARHAALTGHDSAVVGCSLSRDASMLVSASLDGTSALWDPGQGRLLGRWAPHDDHVTCCAIDDGGRWVVTGSADGTARYWPVPSTPSVPGRENRHHGEIMQCVLAASGRVLLTAATDMSVRRWQADDLTVPARLLGELVTPVTALATDADASVVLVGGAQGELILGRADSWQMLMADGPVITSCALASDARIALVGDESGSVGLWQLGPAPSRIALSDAHDDWILCCAIDNSGNVGMSVDDGENSLVRFWDLRTGLPVASFRLGGSASACSLTRDGRLVTSALTDGRVQIQDRRGNLLRGYGEPSGDRILAAAASLDGSRCMTVTRSGRLSHWTNDQLDMKLEVHPPSGIAISDDLTSLVIGLSLGDLAIYHISPAHRENSGG